MKDILERAKAIKLVIFDVDGVLTDGSLFLGDDGLEYKAFNSRDGHGMKMLQEAGVTVGIITGRTSKVVDYRMQSLGIEHVYQGQHDKRIAFSEILEKLQLSPQQVAYVGDDVVDLPVMSKVGLAIAVQDAHPMVLKHAHWQTPSPGGRGAGRDVCEMLMEAHGVLQQTLNSYLQ
ncbi:3-deoxy-manno-octulosonate-8-phosphatase KdsC [Sulfuriflexus mobilis]|uniref:3-deoxy-manno-octulosonate-8-phosphatase KdsC n=1 Tax=Sulfuriflexus mobilis TaxID=1811807 RepID=UPI000F83E89C|nr:3-deoxy-manno-octulosonate-8-phosphatase KdsC [Sulfuriflexus mobilis]